jgi:hypothetical protein
MHRKYTFRELAPGAWLSAMRRPQVGTGRTNVAQFMEIRVGTTLWWDPGLFPVTKHASPGPGSKSAADRATTPDSTISLRPKPEVRRYRETLLASSPIYTDSRGIEKEVP